MIERESPGRKLFGPFSYIQNDGRIVHNFMVQFKYENRATNRNLWRCLMRLAIHLVTIMVLVILGVIFLNGKGAFLIAGYNTASKAEKQKTDEKKLCSFMGKMMFILAGCWLVIASSEIFKAMWLLWVGLCLFFVVCVGAVIYMNSGNRFKR